MDAHKTFIHASFLTLVLASLALVPASASAFSAPSCTLNLSATTLSWTSQSATEVVIAPLTNSPAVPGASTSTVSAPGVSQTFFFEGFETNPFTSGWVLTNNQGTWKWRTTGGNVHIHSGVHSMNAGPNQDGGLFTDTITRTVSTAGHTSVTLSYWFLANDLRKGQDESLYVEWTADGATWNVAFTIDDKNDNNNWEFRSHTLPASAANNPNFKVRFRANLHGDHDDVWIDDVSLSGTTASGPETIPPLSDTFTFTPPLGVGTHTYKLTATGPGGTEMCQATVVVPPSPPPPPPPNAPTVDITATPGAIISGDSSSLSWTSTNATSCTGTGFSTGGATSGSLIVFPTVTTTYSVSCSGPDGTATDDDTVTVTSPPSSGPSCALTLSNTEITTGGHTTISWTSTNATSGLIFPLVGTTTPVSGGSFDVFPPDSTTFTGTFSGPTGTTTCSVIVIVQTGGGGGGGLNQPTVTLLSAPGGQVLSAFVSLSQVPYTGFEAGPLLTLLFWLSVVLWSAGIAYVIIGRESMRFIAGSLFALGGAPIDKHNENNEYVAYEDWAHSEQEHATAMAHRESDIDHPSLSATPSRALVPTVITAPSAREAAVDGVPSLTNVIESRAHAAGVLLSPEAVSTVAVLSPDRAETLRMFGDILNKAIQTIPREDGWILISSDGLASLMPGREGSAVSTESAGTPFPDVVLDAVPERIVCAILDGKREDAFALVRDLEKAGTPATGIITTLVALSDELYRARRDNVVLKDLSMQERIVRVPQEKLHTLATLFSNILGATYALPYTGFKIALAQAFDT